jgi:hypothetical protein
VIKTGDPEKTRINLKFLLEAGLVSDDGTANRLRAFLERAPAADIPSLPVSDAATQGRPRLQILSIGISKYTDGNQQGYATKGAQDVGSLLLSSAKTLYEKATLQTLTDANATRDKIYDSLYTLRTVQSPGDIAVIYFSGRSMYLKDQFYVLPYDVDFSRSDARIKASAVSFYELRDELRKLGERGLVLLLLDTCPEVPPNISAEGIVFALPDDRGVSVLAAAAQGTSCQVVQDSTAFTHALLTGIRGAADFDKDGFISVTELAEYVSRTVSVVTHGAQNPVLSLRYNRRMFGSVL